MSRVFDGAGADRLVYEGALVSAYPLTMLIWVKTAALGGIIHSYANTATNNFIVSSQGTGIIRAQSNQQFGGSNANTTTTVTLDVWYPVIVVVQANETIDLYALGDSIAGAATGDMIAETSPRYSIGTPSYNTGLVPLNGKVAHAAIWSSELDSTDIAALIAGTDPSTISSGTLIEYWPLTDSSLVGINGRTLVLTGTAANDDADNPSVGSSTPPVEITSVTNATITHGQTGIGITGSGFSASGNTVLVSPTDDPDDVAAVAQTITAESDTSITFTAVLSSFNFNDTLYLFVVNADTDSNAAGEPVSRIVAAASFSVTLIAENETPAASQTDITLKIWRADTPAGAHSEELTGLATDGSGVLTTSIALGTLDDGDYVCWMAFRGSPATQFGAGRKLPTYT